MTDQNGGIVLLDDKAAKKFTRDIQKGDPDTKIEIVDMSKSKSLKAAQIADELNPAKRTALKLSGARDINTNITFEQRIGQNDIVEDFMQPRNVAGKGGIGTIQLGENTGKITNLNAKKLTDAVEAMGQPIKAGDRVVIKTVEGKVVDVRPYEGTPVDSVLKPDDGSISRVYELDGVGYAGKNPVFVNVTDDVVKQSKIKADEVDFAAKAVGKEGTGGEYFKTDEGPLQNQDISRFNFNKYLRDLIGPPPIDMVDPHAHHVLFKEGNGAAQKELVREGQALLQRYGINPVFGKENLVWAPNRIAGQHDYAALKYVVDQLKEVERYGGDYDDIIRALGELGRKAATRRK